MDDRGLRLECLKLAAGLGGSVETVVKAAEKIYDFVAQPQPLGTLVADADMRLTGTK